VQPYPRLKEWSEIPRSLARSLINFEYNPNVAPTEQVPAFLAERGKPLATRMARFGINLASSGGKRRPPNLSGAATSLEGMDRSALLAPGMLRPAYLKLKLNPPIFAKRRRRAAHYSGSARLHGRDRQGALSAGSNSRQPASLVSCGHARHVRERIRVHRLDLGLLRKRWRNAPRLLIPPMAVSRSI
jgi:hypothetical protein